jgi:hypothetical protein
MMAPFPLASLSLLGIKDVPARFAGFVTVGIAAFSCSLRREARELTYVLNLTRG